MKSSMIVLITALMSLTVLTPVHAAPGELTQRLEPLSRAPGNGDLFQAAFSDNTIQIARRNKHRWNGNNRRHNRRRNDNRRRRNAAGAFIGGAIIGGVIANSAARAEERRDRYYDYNKRYDYYNNGQYPQYYPY